MSIFVGTPKSLKLPNGLSWVVLISLHPFYQDVTQKNLVYSEEPGVHPMDLWTPIVINIRGYSSKLRHGCSYFIIVLECLPI